MISPKRVFLLLFIVCFIQVSAQKDKSGFQMHQKQQLLQPHQKHSKKTKANADKQKFQLNDFFGSLQDTYNSIKTFTTDVFDHFVLRVSKPLGKKSVIYRQNFASENGGAQILMVSSSKIKSPKAILKSDPDSYLFTADVLPITIVIGLKEQILIDSFAIQSGQQYSCITQDFMLEGAFSLENQEWILLGNFTADNSFQVQQFAVEQRIIRYLKLTILSSYSNWKYFTLTLVKVYGEGLFSHAMESLLQSEYNISNQTQHSHGKGVKNMYAGSGASKQIHTKQILAEAFEQLIVQQNQNLANNKQKSSVSKPDTTSSHFTTQYQKNNQSVLSPKQKTSTKQKKSMLNLKKKIQYLQKRNFELHQELKELKLQTEEKITQLQLKSHHGHGQNHKHHKEWYEVLFSSQTMIIISMIINVVCLTLVALVFKHKILNKRQSIRLRQSSQSLEEKPQNNQRDKVKNP